jgi:hypothetical protein
VVGKHLRAPVVAVNRNNDPPATMALVLFRPLTIPSSTGIATESAESIGPGTESGAVAEDDVMDVD